MEQGADSRKEETPAVVFTWWGIVLGKGYPHADINRVIQGAGETFAMQAWVIDLRSPEVHIYAGWARQPLQDRGSSELLARDITHMCELWFD